MTIFSFQDSLLHCLRRRIGSIINLRGQNCCPGSPNLPLGNLTRRRRAKYCLAASQAFSLWTISDNFGVRRIMWKWLWKMISLSFKLKSVFLKKTLWKIGSLKKLQKLSHWNQENQWAVFAIFSISYEPYYRFVIRFVII